MESLKVIAEFTGINAFGDRMHLVRLTENGLVTKSEIRKGDDVAHDFMTAHGLLATGLDHTSPRREEWTVELAPSSEDIDEA